MAKSASTCFFLFFLYFLCRCSSGTMVGFSYHANGNTTTSSPGRTIAFLKRNKIVASHIRVFVEDQRLLRSLGDTGVSVDLYLNEGHLQISELKSYIMPFLSQVKIKSIVATSGDYTRQHALSMLLTTLKSVNSILSSFTADRGVKVSAAFPLSYLENVSTADRRDLHRICDFIKKVKSCVVIEAEIDGELSIGERYVNAMIESARLAHTLFPCNDVPMMLTFKSPAVPSATEVAAFVEKVSKALENSTNIANSIVGMYAQVSPMEDFTEKEMKRAEEQLFATSRRELLRSDLYEAEDSSPTIFPTTPTPPISTNIPTPTIITVPTTNPVTVAPFNPMPSTTPVTVSSTNPVYSPIPEANPTTAPPITVHLVVTNPVITYPPPTGPVPVTTPLAPPATSTNAPGQSWCVAKAGAAAAAVQAGLDYACGKVDCSQLQQGGSCFSPVTLQNHASYAFNSYYQKNPVATSCDFGGVATIVATNPSTGSCSYLSSSTTATPTTAPPITVPLVTTNPVTTYPPPTGPVPVTTPLAPPATSTNAPGQSWCVAKAGATAAAVQAGLDYACGKVDCSQLQQGGSCFSPVTLQNHASYAFNSYYQKNPVATSCDFGGVATIVATNPSTGSCSYLSSSTTATPTPAITTPPISTPFAPVVTTPTPTPEPTTPLPASTTPPTPTFTAFPPPEAVSGSGIPPPSVLNSSNPASSGSMPEFGMDIPPGYNSSTSSAASLQPFVSYMFLLTAMVKFCYHNM